MFASERGGDTLKAYGPRTTFSWAFICIVRRPVVVGVCDNHLGSHTSSLFVKIISRISRTEKDYIK